MPVEQLERQVLNNYYEEVEDSLTPNNYLDWREVEKTLKGVVSPDLYKYPELDYDTSFDWGEAYSR